MDSSKINVRNFVYILGGHEFFPEDLDEQVLKEVNKIKSYYVEFKRKYGFTESGLQAKEKWLRENISRLEL